MPMEMIADFFRDYWEQVLTLVTLCIVLATYLRARSIWKSRHFMTRVNFSLNYVQDGRLKIRTLGEMGARMVTSIEYAKRFQNPDTDQRLLYALLPKLPQSPGGFSEAQLRWIVGHFPEDFAEACRHRLKALGI